MAEVEEQVIGGDNKKAEKFARKSAFFSRLQEYLEVYPKAFIVLADNVGSSQMQRIRKSLRGKAVVLMGKNTMMRKAIRLILENNPKLEKLLGHIYGNIGFIFTDGDLVEVRKIINDNRVGAPAKAGAIAPCDVIVPAGPTGMEPSQTSFLQALNIASKISKGQIEILSDVPLLKKGDKVGPSEATLLAKLSIRPFSYGLETRVIYDNGSIYDAAVLDVTFEDIVAKFAGAANNIAAISLEIGYPTYVSVPHSLVNAFKKVLAVSVETDYTIKEAEKIKEYIKNPSAFAAAAPAAAAAAPAAAGGASKKPEPEPEEEDADMGFDMFG
jgi:large subunit ribosomal protein LP0